VTAEACTEPGAWTRCNWNDPGYENHPVTYVDWNQAKTYCDWAGGRLPTEAEWEYAARSAGQPIEYPWRHETATCHWALMYNGVANGCGTGRTWPVCSKPSGNTAQGLCDMAGNVWEWVQDWYHSDYEGAPNDGNAWEDPVGSDRVGRGGSILSDADYLRTFRRDHTDPATQYYDLGIRCVKDAP